MKLKESFRLQSHLSRLHDEALLLLGPSNFATLTVTNYLKKAGIAEEDEFIPKKDVVVKPFEFSFAKVVDFIQNLEDEKMGLTLAIEKTEKEYSDFCLEAVKQRNIQRQQLVSYLKICSKVVTEERNGTGVRYLKDNDGRQTNFRYETLETKEFDIDKKVAKAIAKRLSSECDADSLKIDEAVINRVVDYTCLYSYDDSLEEAYEKFCNQK